MRLSLTCCLFRVEFDGKFYMAAGHAFKPLSFRIMQQEAEAAEQDA